MLQQAGPTVDDIIAAPRQPQGQALQLLHSAALVANGDGGDHDPQAGLGLQLGGRIDRTQTGPSVSGHGSHSMDVARGRGKRRSREDEEDREDEEGEEEDEEEGEEDEVQQERAKSSSQEQVADRRSFALQGTGEYETSNADATLGDALVPHQLFPPAPQSPLKAASAADASAERSDAAAGGTLGAFKPWREDAERGQAQARYAVAATEDRGRVWSCSEHLWLFRSLLCILHWSGSAPGTSVIVLRFLSPVYPQCVETQALIHRLHRPDQMRYAQCFGRIELSDGMTGFSVQARCFVCRISSGAMVNHRCEDYGSIELYVRFDAPLLRIRRKGQLLPRLLCGQLCPWEHSRFHQSRRFLLIVGKEGNTRCNKVLKNVHNVYHTYIVAGHCFCGLIEVTLYSYNCLRRTQILQTNAFSCVYLITVLYHSL